MTATTFFKRRTDAVAAPGHQLHELEGIRAIAAFAVMTTHAAFLSGAVGRSVLPGFLARMDFGVALFFVLSGFLLFGPHARSAAGRGRVPRLSSYAARRAARLLPAWALVLVGTLVLVPDARHAGVGPWVANLLQLQSLRTTWDLPGLAQLWSLSTELAFYLALPLAALLIRHATAGRPAGTRLVALAGLAGAVWVFRFVVDLGLLPGDWAWGRTLPGVGDWFVVGMLFAELAADPAHWARPIAVIRACPLHLYAAAACIFWVLTTRLAGPYDLTLPANWQADAKHLGYAVVAGLLVAPSVFGARTRLSPVLSSRVSVYLGTVSYGFFLWHLPVMFWVRSVLHEGIFTGGFWLTVLGTIAIALPISAASWHLLEAPVQRLVRERTADRPPREVAVEHRREQGEGEHL